MKHFTLVTVGRYRRLYDAEGMPVDLFNRAMVVMSDEEGLAEWTKTGYSEHIANCLDYLCELGVLDTENPPSLSYAQKVFNLYPRFLEDATLINDPLLAKVAHELGRTPIAKVSSAKHCAAINKFAEIVGRIQKQESDVREAIQIDTPAAHHLPLRSETRRRSHFEVLRLQQNSLVAGCINGANLKSTKRTQGLRTNVGEQTFAGKDFPKSRLVLSIRQANNSRDYLLWLTLGATGLRFSEALQLRKSEINLDLRTIKVHDPYGRRNPISKEEARLPNKGRRTTNVYILEPLKDMLFLAIEAYLKDRPQVLDQDYLFLHNTVEKYGEPLCTSSSFKVLNGTCNRAFKKAQLRNSHHDQPVKLFSLHSLRHFYAMWLKNCTRRKGSLKLGLETYDVQRLMGHKKIETTMRYCHDDQAIIDIQMEAADLSMSGNFGEVNLDAYYGSALIEYGKNLMTKSKMELIEA